MTIEYQAPAGKSEEKDKATHESPTPDRPGDSPSTDTSSSITEATAFPPPGSSSQEILAWWGQRTLKTSRTFAAQREERTHRELLERLRQSLALQNKDLQTKTSPAEPVLAACLYLAIHCAQCESVRQGRPDYPESSTVPCPRCGSECSFTVLGAGVTRKPLPFYEVKKTDPQSEEGRPRIPWDPLPSLARTKRKAGEE